MYLDYNIIPQSASKAEHIDVLLASLPKEIVDSYVAVLEKAGLRPLVLEIESLALSRALVENGVSPLPVLLVDMGTSNTNVSIFSGRSLRLTASLAVSTQRFAQTIQKALRVDEEKADEFMREYGLIHEEDPLGKRVKSALFPALEEFAEQIENYMEYHESHTPHQHGGEEQKKVKKIMLCGGGANLRGLPDFLTKILKTEVVVGNPWVNILSSESREIPELSFQESLRYATALGLALRGIRDAYD